MRMMICITLLSIGCATTQDTQSTTEAVSQLFKGIAEASPKPYLVLIDGTKIGPFNNIYGCLQYRRAMNGVGTCMMAHGEK